jgi:hypothetical protein
MTRHRGLLGAAAGTIGVLLLSSTALPRAYPKLIHYNKLEGSQFSAWQQPELFSEELRAARFDRSADTSNPYHPFYPRTT